MLYLRIIQKLFFSAFCQNYLDFIIQLSISKKELLILISTMLNSQQDNNQDLRDFLKEHYPQNTQRIDLSIVYQIPIYASGVKVVAEVITWNIKYLNLCMYKLGDEGLQELIKVGKQWSTLESLSIQQNNLTCEGFMGISQTNWKIKKLYMTKNKIKAKGLKEIVKAKWDLILLNISHSQIRSQGAKLIREAEWNNLQILQLNYCLIGNEGMKHLSYCSFQKLVYIELSNNKLDAIGMFYLSKMNLPALTTLGLNRNLIGKQKKQFSEIGCIYLSRIKVSGLERLNLFGNSISLEGIRIVLYRTKLVEDCYLELVRNNFEFEDIYEDIKKLKLFCNMFGPS